MEKILNFLLSIVRLSNCGTSFILAADFFGHDSRKIIKIRLTEHLPRKYCRRRAKHCIRDSGWRNWWLGAQDRDKWLLAKD